MKYFILPAVLLFMFAAIVHAAPVNMERAEQVAAKWFAPDGARSDQGIRNIIVKQYNGHDSLYIINLEGGGWVIVPASDSVIPVLAYSYEGEITEDMKNPGAEAWVSNYYQRYIDEVISKDIDNAVTLPLWNDIETGKTGRAARV